MPDLASLRLSQLARAQQTALIRLLLMATGETHLLFAGYAGRLAARLRRAARSDGTISTTKMPGLSRVAEEEWRETFDRWAALFETARREAAAIPFGAMARQHEAYMRAGQKALAEAGPAFDPELFLADQLAELIEAANSRVYGDGFRLSQRIWRLHGESLTGIKQTIERSIVTGNSAWNTAKKLEQYLGANQDCPRWTTTRLFKLSPAQRLTSERGLIRAGDCAGQGVAANALRLARNEIQVIHHMATDRIMARSPWIEQEQIHLSPQHPKPDMCDDVVSGSPYPKGAITLPLHVACLCYKSAVLMPPDEFASNLGGWMRGTSSWQAMDDYAGWLGVGRSRVLGEAAQQPVVTVPGLVETLGLALATWRWGDRTALRKALGLA